MRLEGLDMLKRTNDDAFNKMSKNRWNNYFINMLISYAMLTN